MQQLREIRRRIASIDEIRQLTKAMHTIALSRTFRLKEQLRASRAYANGADQVLDALLEGLEEAHPLTRAVGGHRGLFVVNADRGLCGGFNNNILRRAMAYLCEEGGNKEITLTLVGKKARDYFRKR
ncbi:MAG: F0F1 ATP synthase subunit gamma, partial [Candidatus Bipolaricaulia bacterium]